MGDPNNVPFLPAGFDDADYEKMLRFSDWADGKTAEEVNEEKYLNFEGI